MALAIPPRQLQMMGLMLQREEDDAAVVALLLYYRRRRRRRHRQRWMRSWLSRRLLFGDYEYIMAELERESKGDFVAYLRMEPAMFHELLQRMTPRLSKKDTKWRKALNPGLRLAVTLRHLATGNSFHSLAFAFRAPTTPSQSLSGRSAKQLLKSTVMKWCPYPPQ